MRGKHYQRALTDPQEGRKMSDVSPVSSWKREKSPVLTLPSGNRVKVFNPGMKTFLVNGTMPNSLMSLAEGALQKGQPLGENEMENLLNDPKKIADMLQFVDKLTMAVVVEPKVHPTPEEGADRSDDVLYVDDMDDEDKLFIFQWATGGTTDLEQFRDELAGTLASVQPGGDLASQAE